MEPIRDNSEYARARVMLSIYQAETADWPGNPDSFRSAYLEGLRANIERLEAAIRDWESKLQDRR